MGQKVHPTGIRLGISQDWSAKWYSGTQFADFLIGDLQARQYLKKHLNDAAISRIEIERLAQNARITIYSARPGMLIGKKGSDVESLRAPVSHIMGVPVVINIEEVRKPEVDATLVAESVAKQLESRVMFRRAMKRAVSNAMRQGAKGVKIRVAGRLGGAEIARSEWYREGRVPLHTLRAEVDYGTARAATTYGIIGVKVWIFKGEKVAQKNTQAKQAVQEAEE